MHLRRTLCAAALVLLTAPRARAQDAVPIYDDLGDLHREITTDVPLARRYFDQGLRLLYAFNHAEAIRSFDAAIALDPGCAMCYWGIAHAYGPNINAAMDSASGAAAYTAIRQAQALAAGASPVERALIEALAVRYGPDPTAQRAQRDSAFARAMADVARAHPGDPDVAVLHANALMNLSPWVYWTDAGEPRPATPEILSTLEGVIQRYPDHPGACHLYIHAVEEVHPERAVACAERLARLMPGAGHLQHMPAHVYIRVGRYVDAIEANRHAVHADETFIGERRPAGEYPLAYYPHNYHFLAFAAAMAGQGATALDAARSTAEVVDRGLVEAPGFAVLQHFLATPLFTQVRFGRWDEILRQPRPEPALPYTTGVWHFARGMALLRGGETEQAEAELAALWSAARTPGLEEAYIFNWNSLASVLTIAAELLAGETALARGDAETGIAQLREAARREDAMIYGEPPDWPIPVRHFLGAALLETGRPAEAEEVYRQDLRRFPDNGWALAGLAESLRAQGRTAEAAEATQRLRHAWWTADVQLRASRF